MRIADTLIIDILNAHCGLELSRGHVYLRVAIATAVLWLYQPCSYTVPALPVLVIGVRFWLIKLKRIGKLSMVFYYSGLLICQSNQWILDTFLEIRNLGLLI